MKHPASLPIYIIDESNPIVRQWEHALSIFGKPENHTLKLNIFEGLVDLKSVGMIHQMIAALQHYPQLIEKMIFAIDFNFAEVENCELFIPPHCWKSDPKYYAWFAELNTLPVVLFFINDEDARYYALMGDMIVNGEIEINHFKDKIRSELKLQGRAWHKFLNRVFQSCLMMLLYCHNTGFNPERYIQSILADLDVSELWDDIFNKYQSDAEKYRRLISKSSEVDV